MAGARRWPTIQIVEESPREGIQIESRSITASQKKELIERLARTGLSTIVVGAFVSPKWVPQMTDVDDVIRRISPVEGVRFRALAFNEKGRQRRDALTPPVTPSPENERWMTRVHLCDVFVRRNLNITQDQEVASWPGIIETARMAGAKEASIGINAAWGSNFQGEFSSTQRTGFLQRQLELWQEAGIPVRRVWIGDPMGWNTPFQMREQLEELQELMPDVEEYHLHLHDTRGLALTSAWSAVEALEPSRRLVIDSSIGGIGGCPYCGTGRATGMIPTEDLVALLKRMGQADEIDLDAVIDTARWLAGVLGRPLHGRVADAGGAPIADRLFPYDLPLIETFEEAQHVFVGSRAHANSRSPWKEGDALFQLISSGETL